MLDEDDLEKLAERVKINKDELDREMIESPQLIYAINELLTEAQDRKDYVKNQIKQADASLTFKYIKKYERLNKRITDRMLKLEVQGDDEMIALENKLRHREKMVNRISGLKEALQNRSFMLGRLGNLYTSGYWAGDAVAGSKQVDDVRYNTWRKKQADRRRRRDRGNRE